ncbi:hypothetical protein [[Actinomadura] parvosata]|nr:hypothetical protein [Nonomuraea sp. ATCC 55076]
MRARTTVASGMPAPEQSRTMLACSRSAGRPCTSPLRTVLRTVVLDA